MQTESITEKTQKWKPYADNMKKFLQCAINELIVWVFMSVTKHEDKSLIQKTFPFSRRKIKNEKLFHIHKCYNDFVTILKCNTDIIW